MVEKANFIPELIKIVPPPQKPTDTNESGQWAAIQKEMNTALPNDLLDYCINYGSGSFKHTSGIFSMKVFNPLSRRYRRDVTEMQRVLRYNKPPFEIHPSSSGILTWGVDESRRQFCWLTDGSPDSWPTIFITVERNSLRFETSLSGFLVMLFSGQIDDFGAEMTAEWFKEQTGEFYFKAAKPYDPSRWPPLWEAVLMLDREKTRQLLAEGADPNTLWSEETPLFAAIDNVCDEELVKLLLAAGANPSVSGEEGRTPLQLAASSDYMPNCVELLLSAGAEVSSKDEDGWSALLWACNRKFEDRVQLLLAHGADPNDRLPNGKTALQLARQNEAICNMLVDAGAKE